jgi:hypothetical protein
MNPCATRLAAFHLGLRWRLLVYVLASLVVLACEGHSFDPPQSQPYVQTQELPHLTIDVGDNRLEFVPWTGSRVQLQGTATIGSWKSESNEVHGNVILDTDATALTKLFDRIESDAADKEGQLPPPTLTLPVRTPPTANISVRVLSLHGSSQGMDNDMQKAMKADQHPLIEYVYRSVQEAKVQRDSQSHRAGLKLRVAGTLSMAGTTRAITMDAIVQRDSHQHFLVRAETSLLMSDFGVVPPGKLFGLIKAGDRVEVSFDLDFAIAEPPSAPPR